VEASLAGDQGYDLALVPAPPVTGYLPCAPSARSTAYELARMRRFACVPMRYSAAQRDVMTLGTKTIRMVI
jgi:hypothetical protein